MNKIIDFSKYSSIKIGSKLRVEIIDKIDSYDDYCIIGKANNILISKNPKSKIAILGKKFSYIKEQDETIIIGGATASGRIFSFAKKNNLSGFEYLSKLPGSLGGLVKMNAGMGDYEIFNNLKSIKTKNGNIEKKDINFGYRVTNIKDIIYEVTFYKKYKFNHNLLDIFSQARNRQPSEPSAGSLFKNPKGDFAGRLIEAVGLKGKIIGGASLSNKHANFLININSATFDDAIELSLLARKRVLEEFGILLEYEIDIIK